MARTTQFIGHTNSVYAYLDKCQKCEQAGVVEGMFGEIAYNLFVYVDCFGTEWREFVQAEPWSSGPMIFLGLKSESQVFGWTKKPSSKEMVDRENGLYWV